MKMKKISIFFILVIVLSCKNEEKTQKENNTPETVKKEFKTVKNFTNQDLLTFTKVRVDLESGIDSEYDDDVYRLSRNSNTESAYLSTMLIPVTYASEYKVSIIVKKGELGKLFGLRISGTYPDRADAIFDIENGSVLDYKIAQDFERPLAVIEKLGGGWYKCSLSAKVAADDIRIIFGPTVSEKNVLGWEGKTETLDDVHLRLSSLIIEKLM